MIKNLEESITRIINKDVEHQNIGGKEIIIEKEADINYFLDRSFNDMTIAEFNFINRRMDLINEEKPIKIYYGHVYPFGYFVAEDELE